MKDLHSLGDFNFNALAPEKNLLLSELENWNFEQMVKNATHIQGGLIDQCYKPHSLANSLIQKSDYYTDLDVNKAYC